MLLQENKHVVLIKGYTNRKNFKIEMCTTKTNQENPTNQQINKKKFHKTWEKIISYMIFS